MMRTILATILLAAILQACSTDEGRRLYEAEQYTEAAAVWMRDFQQQGAVHSLYNLGSAMYRNEQYQNSVTAFALAATHQADPAHRGDALHNAGNAAYRSGNLAQAIALYRASLAEREDEDTRINLELAKRKLEHLQQQLRQQQMMQQQEQQSDATDTTQSQQRSEGDPDQQQEQQQAEGSGDEETAREQVQAEPDESGQDEQESDTESVRPSADKPQAKEPGNNVMLRQRLEHLQEGNPLQYGANNSGLKPEKSW